MPTALVIGANSDIAVAAIEMLKGWDIIHWTRHNGDLTDPDTEHALRTTLLTREPDVVIHCAGVFGGNDLQFTSTFRTNTESAWWPIKFYLDNPPNKQVKIILIGSSCYEHGRRNYILYAASKAALHSIWQGASEAINSNVKIGIIHPVRVNTKLVEHITHPNPELCLTAEDVANEIIKLTTMSEHTHLDMGYHKEKK